MYRKLAIALFVHSLRSDWNNGNAHFLRGLARALGNGPPGGVSKPISCQGHRVLIFEQETNWSVENLATEARGNAALMQFASAYPDLDVRSYRLDRAGVRAAVEGMDIVIVHEWNTPELIEYVLSLRDELSFRALFHDTHHRASSSPQQLRLLQVARFDGVLAFGEALRALYRSRFGVERVWTLHEAADTSVFYPRVASRQTDVVWIGNWGDDERSREIREFLIYPAAELPLRSFCVYGVRYPRSGLNELAAAGIRFGGYLPNLDAPAAYAAAGLTLHIPRQQYSGAMKGIPTIRVFEALASGLPLISAPWQDVEGLFGSEDFLFATTSEEMIDLITALLDDPKAAHMQASKGLATVLARHTCAHRAMELSRICEEVLAQ
jgi:spore maturation protein CgeB